ncbi:S49 family peptidase [Rhodomicrobium vannielii ATCC 17100]|uniref:S49 family peptidase n=1 Tax=Rhodomicrobium vannielii TaxID=1069 RepID=UPI00191A48C6|nr:S49 family peptidase [Rhodomicrobium vannielii ATCC 17100]
MRVSMDVDSESSPATRPNTSMWGNIFPGNLFSSGRTTIPVVRLSGAIGAASPLRQGLTLSGCATALDRAFATKGPAVILQINSPGGSPVQSRLIYDRIVALKEEHDKKVYAFCEDVAASGGYMIACAADEIYADGSSIVGSIGVISAGFGFVHLIHKLGIDRRVYTSGENKMQLDPFRPEKPEEISRLKRLQAIVHEDFIALVKESRGDRIANSGGNLFTGEFWAGRQALELGLIDGIIDLRAKMRSEYGDKVRLKLISTERGFFRRKAGVGVSVSGTGMGISFAQGFADDLISALEERAIWARFGL